MKLYKRNAQGKPISWEINVLNDHDIQICYGLVGGNIHHEVIHTNRNPSKEKESLIKAKRKEGYKQIQDLYDNAPEFINGQDLAKYLNTYLPKFNTHDDGKFIPMLCKTLEDNKPFEKGSYFGQWKINGERCIITASKGHDIFQTIKLHYRSREGVDWTDKLSYMDEFILPAIQGDIFDMMIEEGIGLDGELYLPGYNINQINSFIKNTELPQHYQLQYWCYDLCIENMIASKRYESLAVHFNRYKLDLNCSKEEHLNNKNNFILLPTANIHNINDAILFRDNFINCGFEGLVIREENAEYQFGGKRNNSMLKFKRKEDGKFTIVDVKLDKRGLPIFVLENDINNELFECTLNASQSDQQTAALYAIGKTALVEYRERSGVKQVPFHAKITKIYES